MSRPSGGHRTTGKSHGLLQERAHRHGALELGGSRARLHDADAECRDEGERSNAGGADGERVPAHELAPAVPQRVALGHDRHVALPAPQFVDQLRHGFVAPRGVGMQCTIEHGGDVALQLRLQLPHREPARRSRRHAVLFGLCAVFGMVSTCSRGGHDPYDARTPNEDHFAGRLPLAKYRCQFFLHSSAHSAEPNHRPSMQIRALMSLARIMPFPLDRMASQCHRRHKRIRLFGGKSCEWTTSSRLRHSCCASRWPCPRQRASFTA